MSVAFIVGCARSGTSILGELIAAHPDVKYVFEAFDVWEVVGKGANDSHRFTAEMATAAHRARLRRWAEKERGRAGLLLEKCPRNVLRIPFLQAVFPEAKFVHIVRDGRDVACSMLPGAGGKDWLHLRPPAWKGIFEAHDGAVRCAYGWREIMTSALDDLKSVPHLQIRYEDLVFDPEALASRVLNYLELPPSPAVTAFCGKIQDSTRGSYHAQKQVEWYRENHAKRVGRWRENLTEAEQHQISAALAPMLQRLGYEDDLGMRKAG